MDPTLGPEQGDEKSVWDRPVSPVPTPSGVSQGWVSRLVARYREGGGSVRAAVAAVREPFPRRTGVTGR
jgi:hypothetical protein